MRAGIVLSCVAAVLWTASVATGDEPKELTPERRAELEKVSRRLNNEGVQLYEAGRPAEAVSKFKQSLAADQQLYPKDKYPQGHRSLATSLDNLGALLGSVSQYEAARS